MLRSGRLSLGPMGERFEREFADWLGVEDAVAVSSGTAALHLGVRALGWGAGRRGPDQPLQLRRLGQLPALRGRAAGLLRRRPGDARPRPGRRRGGRRRAHGRASCRSTSSATRRRWPSSRRSPPGHGLGILEDACEALGAVDAEGRRVGARGNLATFAFYANKQMTTGEGGMIDPLRRRDRRAPALASATRAAPPTWAGSTTAASASTTGSPTSPPRSASPSSSGSTRCCARRVARSPPLYERSALAGVEGVEAPIAARRGDGAAQLVRLPRPPAARRSTATRRSPASASAASPARPTCPASTSSRTCASSATARASSRSPKRPPRARWRCPSSPR